MKFRRRREDPIDTAINVTSLIDVMFVLLLFFMVSTTFTKQSNLKVDLPEAGGAQTPVDEKRIEITISASGEYRLNALPLPNASLDALKAALIAQVGSDRNLPFVITADRQTPHHAVVTAMDAAAQLGFARLSITTQQPAGQ
ncbi:MAG: biopolymer transporter ExbD [Pseudomonadales bacterium]|jgi:biopolymer transport protein ExbD|nr:biopolymer transporter ExbD [Pseudomonadales bacterium]MCP5334040.1 biopolymer transporter ExbD [Pseudomonadales bacterium]HMU89426.1 biopolymer transporter ExbD [Pseudomonadales bacterium]HMW15713.1 biopolymer transporter ExbD [Pseudomonadales bacterium]HMW82489.1 biopolymer transporter ExbD [Pseudomonadales bacterium]